MRFIGVWAARRKWVNPASSNTFRSRASQAWAPRASPTSCDSELGVQIDDDATYIRAADLPARVAAAHEAIGDRLAAVVAEQRPDSLAATPQPPADLLKSQALGPQLKRQPGASRA
jgi:hypothetical protein